MNQEKYGELTIVREAGRANGGYVLVECLCSCGRSATVRLAYLKKGTVKSCGHLRAVVAAKLHRKHGEADRSPEYAAWSSMWQRTRDVVTRTRKSYHDRGIVVCERWRSFEAFLSDMGRKPSPSHSLDRIDNDGNYEPGNCRWATSKQQAGNKRYILGRSGLRGVRVNFGRKKRKWVAIVKVDGKDRSVGTFENPTDALAARERAQAVSEERQS